MPPKQETKRTITPGSDRTDKSSACLLPGYHGGDLGTLAERIVQDGSGTSDVPQPSTTSDRYRSTNGGPFLTLTAAATFLHAIAIAVQLFLCEKRDH
jgi:hypothetical protein